ncbi:unnamed protein product [Acanthoscelides obtectus]|uniref:Uncharacterized protein n=1 Tax=Acanthoscelides obtectus TaxID=200917 RepID=A0A9P0JSW7_ACAOB|nr:unnamed protein product [Acanthoscelides obtectus]CAK1633977.1 hypothetical protein AOBTE_LOCUS8515 [Acanthoscelides obtectus]
MEYFVQKIPLLINLHVARPKIACEDLPELLPQIADNEDIHTL